jgi:DNA-binding transcriptional regulator YiaG
MKVRATKSYDTGPGTGSQEKNLNSVRKFRDSLGMTQAALAQVLGLSESIIRQYEAGRHVSDAAADKLKTYAVQRGRADLAALFDPRPFTIRRVFHPAHRGAGIDVHALLDEILQSNDPQAKLAAENFLFITTQYLRGAK